jgi:hypothetical protein
VAFPTLIAVWAVVGKVAGGILFGMMVAAGFVPPGYAVGMSRRTSNIP